jgi:hypothetical protein
LAILQKAGFENAELVAETGFNSSPKTKGVLIRAKKPMALNQKEARPIQPTLIDNIQKSSKKQAADMTTIDDLLNRAFEWGAEKAKLIDTDTIVVEKWVRWKCLYGCPMYNKDGYHPPVAPDTEETREVLREYNIAILLNGSDGKKLTEVAVTLEREAYHMGYYKAFALTALPLGGGTTAHPGAT